MHRLVTFLSITLITISLVLVLYARPVGAAMDCALITYTDPKTSEKSYDVKDVGCKELGGICMFIAAAQDKPANVKCLLLPQKKKNLGPLESPPETDGPGDSFPSKPEQSSPPLLQDQPGRVDPFASPPLQSDADPGGNDSAHPPYNSWSDLLRGDNTDDAYPQWRILKETPAPIPEDRVVPFRYFDPDTGETGTGLMHLDDQSYRQNSYITESSGFNSQAPSPRNGTSPFRQFIDLVSNWLGGLF